MSAKADSESTVPTLHSRRLVLRPWREADGDPFAAMNADPRVAEHLPSVLTRQESDAMLERAQAHFAAHGFGLWAVEVPGVAPFIGFIGLSVAAFEAHFTPTVEIGWRLAAAFWGRGYATEGARAALTFAFESLVLPEVVSFTVAENARSSAVMQANGMQRRAEEDFDHPKLPEGHRLRRHVLYRLPRARWAELTGLASVGPTAVDRARAFADALDADHFERARTSLSPTCVYDVRGATLRGQGEILSSYADATRRARSLFDGVRYESVVEPAPAGARVLFVDVLRHGSHEHRHRCVQHLTVGQSGQVQRIVHEDLDGESEALKRFMARCGVPTS